MSGPDAAEDLSEAALCREFAPRIRAWGLRHLRDEHEAADLVQEVLLVAMEALRDGRIEQPERLASFVLGTCRIVARDRARLRERRRALLERFPLELAPAASPEPEMPADVLECLEELSAASRRVLVMTWYEDLPAERIAATLGTTPGNVRVIRHRALALLRDCARRRTGR